MFFHRIKTEHFVYRNATLSIHEKQCKKELFNKEILVKYMALKRGKRRSYVGLLWWLSGRVSTGQYSRHQFDPWSRMNPHASEQLSPCATATEPVFYSLEAATVEPTYCNYWSLVSLEPMLHKQRVHPYKNPVHCNKWAAPFPHS